MSATFDPALLEQIRTASTVRIHTSRAPGEPTRRTTIWVEPASDAEFLDATLELRPA